ncbi:MAG: cupin domain-containing protein [Cyanobacteria bacterium RM1_2_2]|nr:cupin domain-containing protein [Cyanobacteria bacterium RM1_2_2]
MQSPIQHPHDEAPVQAIQIEHQPSSERLQELGVAQWSIWDKESSEFPWTYDESETCYFLEGEVIVIPEGGAPVPMGQGDLVTFSAGLSCTWKILQPVRKHYRFG